MIKVEDMEVLLAVHQVEVHPERGVDMEMPGPTIMLLLHPLPPPEVEMDLVAVQLGTHMDLEDTEVWLTVVMVVAMVNSRGDKAHQEAVIVITILVVVLMVLEDQQVEISIPQEEMGVMEGVQEVAPVEDINNKVTEVYYFLLLVNLTSTVEVNVFFNLFLIVFSILYLRWRLWWWRPRRLQ